MESYDALSAAVRALLDDLPPPPWWRPIARFRFPDRKAWAVQCAYFGWPQWYHEAIKCGADPDHLMTIHLLVTGRPYPYPHEFM